MRKKKLFPRISAIIIAFAVVFSMCITPIEGGVVQAEEETGQNLEGTTNDVDTNDAVVDDVNTDDLDTGKDVSTLADNASEAQPLDENSEGEDADEAEEDFDVELLYGDPALPDEDALVLTFLGDGFTEDQLGNPENTEYIPDTTKATAEQKKFWNYAQTAATYMMKTSPWDEFKDCIKIYGIGTVSKDTGAKGCDAKTAAEAAKDDRDTYFRSYYWSGGMQRALVIDSYGQAKVNALKEKYVKSDYEVIFVNSEEVGGTGGNICVFSVDPDTYECTLHELGHTVGKLADEYWPGRGYEAANMTSDSNPETIKWSRFLGKNGVGIYEYSDGASGWYRPSQNCKMQFLGEQFPYCEVCKEGLRDTISQLSNVQNISYQLYADEFYEGDELPDMSEYFILRKGKEKSTLQELDKDSYNLEYYKDGTLLDEQPTKAGTYTVKATFNGNDVFPDACELEGEYTIGLPNAVTITAESKTYDGKPANIKYEVDTKKLNITDYDAKLHYTGTDKFAVGESGTYDSDEAPVKPGEYKVNVQIYDKDGTKVSEKNQAFTILFAIDKVVDHENGSNYPVKDDTNYSGAYSYYNNKTIPILGEGFTAEEQDKFDELAAELIEYMRNREPYKETDMYFNYTTIKTVSDNSGIGTTPNGTYFELTYDENGKITPTIENATAAHSVAYEQGNHYYQSAIVIVNDKNAKESAVEDPNAATSIKHRSIFITPDKAGMEFAAQEVLNRIADMDKGYVAKTDEEKSELRARLLDKIVYGGTPSSRPGRASKLYAPVLSTAYNETFVANGKPVDLTPYFITYAGRTPIPAEKVGYDITYYANNNGAVGEKLSGAPSEPGTYYAYAVTKTDGNLDLSDIPGYANNINLVITRGFTSFTISAAGEKPAEVTTSNTVTKEQVTANTNNLNKKIKATQKKNSLAVSWGKVSKADGYEVYAAKCGNNFTKVKTIKGNKTVSYTIKKINGKKLNTKKTYKIYVKAYRVVNGKKEYIGKSLTMHPVGNKNKTYTNAKSVKAAKKSVSLKTGKTKKVSIKVTKQSGKKKLLKASHVAKLRYFSTNAKVATVTSGGTIKAKSKGTCTVYAVAANGVKTSIKVTVK